MVRQQSHNDDNNNNNNNTADQTRPGCLLVASLAAAGVARAKMERGRKRDPKRVKEERREKPRQKYCQSLAADGRSLFLAFPLLSVSVELLLRMLLLVQGKPQKREQILLKKNSERERE